MLYRLALYRLGIYNSGTAETGVVTVEHLSECTVVLKTHTEILPCYRRHIQNDRKFLSVCNAVISIHILVGVVGVYPEEAVLAVVLLIKGGIFCRKRIKLSEIVVEPSVHIELIEQEPVKL